MRAEIPNPAPFHSAYAKAAADRAGKGWSG